MTSEMIGLIVLAYLGGVLTSVVSAAIHDAFEKRRMRKIDSETLDCGFDPSNRINQKSHYWEPFKADDDTVLYRLR